jgi:hypothetical protein
MVGDGRRASKRFTTSGSGNDASRAAQKILYERVHDFRINEDEVLSELRRFLLVFDGYSEGPRAYYRKQIIS